MKNIVYIIAISCLFTACAVQKNQRVDGIELEINGNRWISVPNLDQSSPDDKHYVVRIDSDASTLITFGDGKHGAKPPSDSQTIRIRYRTGGGYIGVRAQQGRVNSDNCK